MALSDLLRCYQDGEKKSSLILLWLLVSSALHGFNLVQVTLKRQRPNNERMVSLQKEQDQFVLSVNIYF